VRANDWAFLGGWLRDLRARSSLAWAAEALALEGDDASEALEECLRDGDDCLDCYDCALAACAAGDVAAVKASLFEASVREHHQGFEAIASAALRALPEAS